MGNILFVHNSVSIPSITCVNSFALEIGPCIVSSVRLNSQYEPLTFFVKVDWCYESRCYYVTFPYLQFIVTQ